MGYTTRFKLYAASQKLTPRAVLKRDETLYPGGKMTGFILWSLHQVEAWSNATKSDPYDASIWPERVTEWIDARIKAQRAKENA